MISQTNQKGSLLKIIYYTMYISEPASNLVLNYQKEVVLYLFSTISQLLLSKEIANLLIRFDNK